MKSQADEQHQSSAKRKAPGRPWVKGQSGNPKGRAKGSGLTDMLRGELKSAASTRPYAEKIAMQMGLDPATTTLGDVLIAASLFGAIQGNASLVNQLWDRAEGKVKETVEHSGPDGGPIQSETKNRVDYHAIETELRRMGGRITSDN